MQFHLPLRLTRSLEHQPDTADRPAPSGSAP
ncbi:Uncharacterised protein [Vibrio cholerae]|nr:Uncharacterised protein [Vibrio cholerae]